ncbi:hypothetical protein TNCV_2143741 [Trichonephila clavipes]|nr:hypothetical protein TNCV_2143741 [Trichonephila clavipes]
MKTSRREFLTDWPTTRLQLMKRGIDMKQHELSYPFLPCKPCSTPCQAGSFMDLGKGKQNEFGFHSESQIRFSIRNSIYLAGKSSRIGKDPSLPKVCRQGSLCDRVLLFTIRNCNVNIEFQDFVFKLHF